MFGPLGPGRSTLISESGLDAVMLAGGMVEGIKPLSTGGLTTVVSPVSRWT